MKVKIMRLFQTDKEYKEKVSGYTKADGLIALVFYLFLMITYYGMGRIYADKQIYLGITCNIGLAILCIIIVLLRKQKISTLGFTSKKIKQSIFLGIVLGLLMVLFNNVIPSILSGCEFNQITGIIYNIFIISS